MVGQLLTVSKISIPNISKMESLEELSLDSNNIKRIPEFVKSLKKLTILSLDNNQVRKIPEFIFDLSTLSILGLDNNNLLRFYDSKKNGSVKQKSGLVRVNDCDERLSKSNNIKFIR